MPYLDLILLIPILWGLFKGFRRGFIIEICTLMGLILGVYGAATFGSMGAEYLESEFHTEPRLSLVLAFAILFVIIVIAVFIFGKMLEGLIKLVALGLVNKIFGMIFGGFKWAIIVSALLYVIDGIPGSLISAEQKKNSYLYEPLSELVPRIYPVLKDPTWREELREELENVKEKVGS